MDDHKFSSEDNVPIMIYPNPLAPEHYFVLNAQLSESRIRLRNPSGHKETNLRVGDFAIFSLNKAKKEALAFGGFFNEQWELQVEEK